MSCSLESQSEELIVGYGAGTLDAGAAAWFERHMERCADCRREAALQQAVWRALDQWSATVLAGGEDSACGAPPCSTSSIGRPGSFAASACLPIKSRMVGTKLKLS